MAPFDCIMLVDDSEADNYLHRLLIERAGLAKTVKEFLYAEEALTFLRSPNRPDIDVILLDINMLGMNGFDFADEFNTLYPELIAQTKLIILTGSIHPDDERRAAEHPSIASFLRKPLAINALLELVGGTGTAPEQPQTP